MGMEQQPLRATSLLNRREAAAPTPQPVTRSTSFIFYSFFFSKIKNY